MTTISSRLGFKFLGSIATRTISGKTGVNARYKVAASDHQYNLSSFSNVASAGTRTLNDDELLTMLQEACFRYYWEGAHPVAGMTLESIPGDDRIVATGASGFGIMALIVGVDREFISREQGLDRLTMIVTFLEKSAPVSRCLVSLHGRQFRTNAAGFRQIR
jgi:hypothetical protein